MLICPRLRLVNVQVTVSPAETLMFVTGLPSLQVALVRSQPAGVFSAATYPEPGMTAPVSCGVAASVRLKLWFRLDGPPVSVNGKLVGSPLGSVTLSIRMCLAAVFVNVQLTTSPTLTSMFVTGLPSLSTSCSVQIPASRQRKRSPGVVARARQDVAAAVRRGGVGQAEALVEVRTSRR